MTLGCAVGLGDEAAMESLIGTSKINLAVANRL